MATNAMAPKLRFKDDEGREFPGWVEVELQSICEINPKTAQLPETFVYVDLESVEKGVLLKQTVIAKKNAPSRAQRVLKSEDVLFQMVRPYQGNNLFFNESGSFVASTGYAQIRTSEDPHFLYHYLHLEGFTAEVMNRCTGTSYPAINSSDLGSIEISFPSIEEQTKIANFLTAVDNKISQLTKKHELLSSYKKGVMQKIFSQELRFKDDDGQKFAGWERTKIGALGKFIGGGTPSTKNPDLWLGDIPWISSSDLNEGSIHEIKLTRRITLEAIQSSATKLVPKNSVLIVSRVGVGKVAVASEDLCTSQDFTNLVLDNADSIFIAYLIKFQSAKLLEFNQGTSIKGFVKADLESMIIDLPSPKEQTKIANFLTAIDDRITNVKSQLEATKRYKQGLLQQMFV